MNKTYSILDSNNIIINVIRCDLEFINRYNLNAVEYIGGDIGDLYDNGTTIPNQQQLQIEIPKSIDPMKLRLALNHFGYRAAVEQVVAGASQDVKDAWEFAVEFSIESPLLNQMRQHPAIGISKEKLEEIFIYGNSLRV